MNTNIQTLWKLTSPFHNPTLQSLKMERKTNFLKFDIFYESAQLLAKSNVDYSEYIPSFFRTPRPRDIFGALKIKLIHQTSRKILKARILDYLDWTKISMPRF